MQRQYWVTKQAVLQKFGRKEDEHVVASDADLDAKLELFLSIAETSTKLQKVIELYQDKLLALSQEENCTGRFLKEQGKLDKTRAGKMMAATGKSLSYTAQQRLALRVPLVRLYQEVETFRTRAIADSAVTVHLMEASRTEYRGALLWMKDVSQELDPDTYKQLDKFRKVQGQVRRTKTKFDKLKIDCLQKIDLLAASRCNMFSHALAVYQNSLLTFCKKTSKTMASVSETFKGYQHYEFTMLKELTEPSKKLAEETSGASRSEGDDDIEDDKLIFFEEYHDDDDEQNGDDKKKTMSTPEKKSQKKTSNAENEDALLDFGTTKEAENETDDQPMSTSKKGDVDLLTGEMGTTILDVDKDDLTLLNEILSIPSGGQASTSESEWTSAFGLPSTSEGFSVNWQSAFTGADGRMPSTMTGEQGSTAGNSSDFFPSQLMDLNLGVGGMNLQQQPKAAGLQPTPTSSAIKTAASATSSSTASATDAAAASTASKKPQQQPPMSAPSKKDKGKDLSMWFNLFADLDPLSNPDAIGKSTKDATQEQDRSC